MSGGGVATSHGRRLTGLLTYIDTKALGEAHARRARVRVAARFPPTGRFPSREDVDQALADTAPTPEETAHE